MITLRYVCDAWQIARPSVSASMRKLQATKKRMSQKKSRKQEAEKEHMKAEKSKEEPSEQDDGSVRRSSRLAKKK